MTTRKEQIGLEIGPRLQSIIEPTEIFIGRSKATEKLYDAEEVRSEALNSCAKEWAKVHGADVEDKDTFWNHIIPRVLFDTLESYSPAAAIVAAEAFLKQFGWKIERPGSGEAELEVVGDEMSAGIRPTGS